MSVFLGRAEKKENHGMALLFKRAFNRVGNKGGFVIIVFENPSA